MTFEEWRDIKDFEGVYQVSNYGRIKSCDRTVEKHYRNGVLVKCQIKEKVIRHFTNNKGYSVIRLYKNRKCYHKLIHRLVAEHFIPNPNEYLEVNHKDENKRNNRVDNLEWCNRRYNNNYGKQSKEGRRKSSNCRMKKVCQWDLNGKLIGIFDGIRIAEEKTGIDNRNICKSCKTDTRTAGGYKWTYHKGECI